VIAGIQVILITQFDIFIPMGVLAMGGAFNSIYFVIIIRVVWDEIYQRRRAAALGARLVSRVAGRWPGNIDVLLDAVNKMRNSYPGETSRISERQYFTAYVADGHWELMERYGATLNLHPLWEDAIITYDPDIIKALISQCSLRNNSHRQDFA